VLAAAVALLNASLSFHNVWPTPAIAWTGELSIEAAIILPLLVFVPICDGVPSRRWIGALAAVWIVLVSGRYADVTTPALYGRDINLYWDARYMPDVAAMVARAAPWWLLITSAAAAAVVVSLLYLLFRWALGRVADGMNRPLERLAVVSYALVVIVLAVLRPATFATPVAATYARQARLVAGAMLASAKLPPSPAMNADLARVNGADVFLIFIESYGAIAYEKPDVAPRLVEPRGILDAAIRDTGRGVVSAFVDSPTFGGSSWLAHISLMSGIEVRDPDTNSRLMTEKRATLVTNFRSRGFRTVALMPGLRQRWPEGAFYDFDEIDGAARLDYHGPEFGWFAIPDQFTVAKFDRLELDRAPRPNLFVFYPTISTHFPFSPTPPYQPDWSRVFDAHPYDAGPIVSAYAAQPDWVHFSPGYVDAVSYTYQTLAGYLRKHAARDIVFVVLGDHQPAAAVAGEGASWSVPVHVVTSRRAILDALAAKGFRPGLTPARPALGRMHELLQMLRDAFSEGG